MYCITSGILADTNYSGYDYSGVISSGVYLLVILHEN